MSRNTVIGWESGKRYPSALKTKEIAKKFNVTASYLSGESESRIMFMPTPVSDMDLSVLNIDGIKKLKEYYELLILDERFRAEGVKG